MTEFNNGFLTAIALFLEHKNLERHIIMEKNREIISDIRLYGATDHLLDLEIPKKIDKKLKLRIKKAINNALTNRLELFKDSKIPNEIFEEFENIMIELDKTLFKLNVEVNYR